MTTTLKRFAAALGIAALAIGVSGGVYAAAQTQNTNPDGRPFMGRGRGPGGPGGPMGPMGFLPMLGHALQLTDAQKGQIKAIADNHRDEWKVLADRGRTAHEALQAAVTADSIDEGLIRQKSADVAAVEADVAVARAHAHAEVLQILTTEQKAHLKTMKAQMQERHGRGRGDF